MNLSDFFRLVTGIKTACTHAGIDAKSAEIIAHVIEDQIDWFEIKGEGTYGSVTLHFAID